MNKAILAVLGIALLAWLVDVTDVLDLPPLLTPVLFGVAMILVLLRMMGDGDRSKM